MELTQLLGVLGSVYHPGTGSSPTPAPEYASDPTGIYVFVAGIGLIVLLFVYFHKQNQKE